MEKDTLIFHDDLTDSDNWVTARAVRRAAAENLNLEAIWIIEPRQISFGKTITDEQRAQHISAGFELEICEDLGLYYRKNPYQKPESEHDTVGRGSEQLLKPPLNPLSPSGDSPYSSLAPSLPSYREARKSQREVPKAVDGLYHCTFVACTEDVNAFRRRCEWSKHMDRHERPYRCAAPGCEKLPGFTHAGGLLRHEREVHFKHGEPMRDGPYRCAAQGCQKRYTSLVHLRRHERATDHGECGGPKPTYSSIYSKQRRPSDGKSSRDGYFDGHLRHGRTYVSARTTSELPKVLKDAIKSEEAYDFSQYWQRVSLFPDLVASRTSLATRALRNVLGSPGKLGLAFTACSGIVAPLCVAARPSPGIAGAALRWAAHGSNMGSAVAVPVLRLVDGMELGWRAGAYAVWAASFTVAAADLIRGHAGAPRRKLLACLVIISGFHLLGFLGQNLSAVDGITIWGPLALTISIYLMSVLLDAKMDDGAKVALEAARGDIPAGQ